MLATPADCSLHPVFGVISGVWLQLCALFRASPSRVCPSSTVRVRAQRLLMFELSACTMIKHVCLLLVSATGLSFYLA